MGVRHLLPRRRIPGNCHHYGYFSKDRKEIGLATREESVFFHELAHAAHQRIAVDFMQIETWHKEVVAELTAAVLCRMVGKTSKYMGNHYQYITHHATEANVSPVRACLAVIGDVEKVLGLILTGNGPVIPRCKPLKIHE